MSLICEIHESVEANNYWDRNVFCVVLNFNNVYFYSEYLTVKIFFHI